MQQWNINSCTLSTEVLACLGLEHCRSRVFVCLRLCVYVPVCWCMILCLWGHLQCLRKAGKNLPLCTSLCVCFWVFVSLSLCVFGAPLSQIATEAGKPFQQRGRGVKQIKHKPTNHRRRLISTVLKGEPGMSDDSPVWISQWRCALCHHEHSLVTERKDQRG